MNKKRIRLALVGIATASTLFACTQASCSDYNLNTNGVDYCYDAGNVYYLPGNTTDRNVAWSFNNNGNFTTDMNYAGGVAELYSNKTYTAYGRKNGVMNVLHNDNNNAGQQYEFAYACLGDTTHIQDYGARNYKGEPCANSTKITETQANELDIRGNIDMVLLSYPNRDIQFCFASSTTNQVLCYFWYGDLFGTQITPTVEAPYTAINIGSNYFENSPHQGGGNSGGGGNNNQNFSNLPMCYTIQQLINSYPKQYSINMCYSANKIWNGTAFETITPQGMTTLRTGYQEYLEDVNLYRNYCNNSVATTEACQQAFTGKIEKWSIINKMTDQTTALRSYQYCHLQLDFTDEQKRTRTNCTISTGTQTAPGITPEDIIEDITNKPIEITTPNGDTVFSGFVNITVGTGENNYDGIIESMQNVRGKLTSIFKYRSGIEGIIPDAIIWILLLIVLFAIFKK